MPPRRSTRSSAAAAAAAPGAPAPAAEAPEAPEPADAVMREAEREEKEGDVAADGAIDDEDDDSTSSDSDSDFEEVDASEEDAAALSKLEEAMEAPSPPSYDDRLLYVSLLRKCGMRERLRSARRAAAAAFPLPEGVWLEWISDERDEARKKLAKNERKRAPLVAELASLHEAAVADFLSVPLWLSYLDTIRELDEGVRSFSAEGAARFRAVADRALALAGLHVGRGEALWRAARAFEVDALRSESAAGDEGRARSLWHGQLSTPLLYERGDGGEPDGDNASVRAGLLAWEAERAPSSPPSLPPHVAAAADAASSAASARAASEEAVGSTKEEKTDEERLAAFMAYVKLEERALARAATAQNAARVAVAHERAVAAFPVTSFLWTSYGSFAESSSLSDVVSPSSVYSRAARNCPWSGELWARALRAAESETTTNESDGDSRFESLFRSAMSSPMRSPDEFAECVLARLDRTRRKAAAAPPADAPSSLAALRSAFSEASQWISSAFPTWLDPGLRLSAYWPQCELALGGGASGAARAWEQLASPSPSAAGALSAEFFAAWARAAVESGLPAPGEEGAAERCSPRAVALGRAILRRALGLDGGGAAKSKKKGKKDADGDDEEISLPPTKKLCDGTAAAAAVASAWLRFEREWGTAEDYRAASSKAAPLLEAAAAEATAAATAAAAAAAEKPKSKEELLALRRERDPNYKKKQEKEKEKGKEKGKEKAAPAAPAAPGSVGGDGEEAPAKRARTDRDEQGGGSGERKSKERSPSAPPRFVPRAADAEHRTAFVRGFPSDATEAALAEFFARASSIADPASSSAAPPLPVVRRPRGPDGRPRGFAYVEFESPEALERAVASADGTAFGGEGGSGGGSGDKASVLSVAVSKPPGPSGGGGRGRGGGRGGGFGRFGGGGGRGRGRGVHLDLGGEGPSAGAAAPPSTTAAASSLVPRSVAKSVAPPKSNADFRALFLGGKKE